jgi:hypothetical protein
VIKPIKWALFLLGLGWAAYSIWGVWVLSHIFPQEHPSNSGLSNILAGAQLFAVTLGPALAAGVFLLIRWPERMKAKNSN